MQRRPDSHSLPRDPFPGNLLACRYPENSRRGSTCTEARELAGALARLACCTKRDATSVGLAASLRALRSRLLWGLMLARAAFCVDCVCLTCLPHLFHSQCPYLRYMAGIRLRVLTMLCC